MSKEALCSNVSDAFSNMENETSIQKPILNEINEELVSTTTESEFIEDLIDGGIAFYEYNDNEIMKRSVKLWQINGVFYNKSEIQSVCISTIEIYAKNSALGGNHMYKQIFYTFTFIFGTLVPLILLATFNCFLVAAVHRSHRMRHTMTNTRQSDRSRAQENKVTVTLIAVVVLFLVCQTPMAIQLIYLMTIGKPNNTELAINIVFNFLVTFNAACNVLLYCALSDKYRKTVKELFLGRKMRRQNTMTSTYFSRGSNQTCSSFYSKTPTAAVSGTNNNSIRNRSTKPNKSRFSITPTDYANFQAEMTVKNAKTRSLAAVDFKTENNRKQNSPHIEMKSLYNESSSKPQRKTSQTIRLHTSPSDTSLTRAQSLTFPNKIKHSPNCKDHPHHKF